MSKRSKKERASEREGGGWRVGDGKDSKIYKRDIIYLLGIKPTLSS